MKPCDTSRNGAGRGTSAAARAVYGKPVLVAVLRDRGSSKVQYVKYDFDLTSRTFSNARVSSTRPDGISPIKSLLGGEKWGVFARETGVGKSLYAQASGGGKPWPTGGYGFFALSEKTPAVRVGDYIFIN